MFLPRSLRTRQGYLLSLFLHKIIPKILARKEKKNIQIGKEEVKVYLQMAYSYMLKIQKKTKKSLPKTLELVSKFSKFIKHVNNLL